MAKELSEMTLEELWELFPIVLKEYNQEYPNWYREEEEKLTEMLNDGTILRISHIGSTAVPGIIAKPTIDILMEIFPATDIEQITDTLKSMQWSLMCSADKPIFKQTYCKGYTKYGFEEKVYHLHVRYPSDWNELYFRDYLIEHPEVASEYVELKKLLKERYEHNRDAYTDAKENFVCKYSEIAKRQYGERYKPMIGKGLINSIIYYENSVTKEELCFLQAAVGFGQANVEQADKAIKNSLFCVSAKVNGQIAGMGRVVGDGARIFYLQDVFIAPDYQRRGIGTEIVTRLVNYIRANAFEHAYTAIGLMAAKGKEDFYLKLGFRLRPNDNEGHGMMYTFNL